MKLNNISKKSNVNNIIYLVYLVITHLLMFILLLDIIILFVNNIYYQGNSFLLRHLMHQFCED